MEQGQRRNYASITAATLLVIGCLYVLRPFFAAILFAAAIVISSWPLYLRLLDNMRGRRSLAAAVMTLGLTLVIIVPLALVAWTLADDVTGFYEQLRRAIETDDLAPPAWLKSIPVVGQQIDAYLSKLLHSREEMIELARRGMEPARKFFLNGGMVLGAGVAQVSLAAFVSFFLYRDGAAIVGALSVAMDRIVGEGGPKVARIVSHTVRGVMYGLLGTALAQSVVAAIGLWIAGVPAVPLLAVATFILSLVPVGPPLVWGGATIWLFNQGQNGWAIFMAIWGLVLISGVDNVVKPMLISRGSDLPFLLVLLGVLGGVLAFGFVGLFIGPTLLAVGYSLLRDWTGVNEEVLVPK